MDSNGGLQLLPETRKKIEVKIPGQNRLTTFSFIFLALILALYGGLMLYQGMLSSDLDEIERQLVDIEKGRDKKEEKKMLDLHNTLSIIRPLLESHVVWSEGLTRIQNLVNPQVQFDSLSAKIDREEYIFKAYAPNYAVIAKQIAAFYTDPAIVDINLGKVTSLPAGKLEFNMLLNLDIDQFLRKNLPKKVERNTDE